MFFFFCEFGCHNLKWSIICWVFLKLVCGITKISQTNTHSQILSQKTLSFPDEFYIVAEKLHMCDGQGQKVQRKWWGRKLSRLKTACTCHPTPPPFLLHNIFTQNLRRILGKFLSFFPLHNEGVWQNVGPLSAMRGWHVTNNYTFHSLPNGF